MLLKPNMVIPGKKFTGGQASPETVADATVACFREVVPAAVPGIVFLSGGQGDEEATANLDAINKLGPHPWQFSFSTAARCRRAALKAWKGEDANIAAGQAAYAQAGEDERSRGDGQVRPVDGSGVVSRPRRRPAWACRSRPPPGGPATDHGCSRRAAAPCRQRGASRAGWSRRAAVP